MTMALVIDILFSGIAANDFVLSSVKTHGYRMNGFCVEYLVEY